MRAVGGANIWLEYADHRNTEFGVELLSLPTRPHPARKGTLVDVPGRNGKLFMDEGAYDRILVPIRMMAVDGNMDAVGGWLSGSGLLRFGDDPNRAYRASVTKEFSVSNRNPRLRGQEFTATFDCEPFRYVYPAPEAIEVTVSGTTIQNPGNVFSQPEISVTGSGDIALVVNGYYVEARGLTDGAIIDCERMETFNLSKTASMNGSFVMDEFPVLRPGPNIITWVGSVTKLEIAPGWRYL